MNGNLFAFRDDLFHLNKDKAKKGCFGGHYNGEEDGIWGQKLKLYSSPGKKIFYAPTVVNEFFPVTFSYCSQSHPDTINCSGAPASVCDPGDLLEKEELRVGDYVFYGTGDREHPNETSTINAFYAIKNSWQWEDDPATPAIDESVTPTIVEAYVASDGQVKAKSDNSVIVTHQRDADGKKIAGVAGSKLFILDITDDLYQSTVADEETRKLYANYVSDAVNHSMNRGWFLRLVEANGSAVGEKVVSSPIIFGGVIYFTTFVPEPEGIDVSDPCANPGARGKGYLYAIGYKYGEAMNDYDPSNNDQYSGSKHREDRRKQLTVAGIPPEPVLVIHEGKPTIITGFTTEDPVFKQSVEVFYWRQLDR